MKQSLLIATALTLAIGPLDLPDAAGLPSFMPSAEASVIIGDRNRIKERPRRNYVSVHTTQDGPGTGSAEITITATIEIVYTSPDGQRIIPPIIIDEASSSVSIYDLLPSGGYDSGALYGAWNGQTFTLSLQDSPEADGTVQSSETLLEDGTLIKARMKANGEIRLRVKEAGSGSAPQALELAGHEIMYKHTNRVWQGEIDTDPRTFDGAGYSRVVTSYDAKGEILDSAEDTSVLQAPEEQPEIFNIPGGQIRNAKLTTNKNGIVRGDFIRRYDARATENYSSNTIKAIIDIEYEELQRSLVSSAPTRSSMAYDFEPEDYDWDALDMDGYSLNVQAPWCGLTPTFYVTLNPQSEHDDEMSGGSPIEGTKLRTRARLRDDGSVRLKINGPSADFPQDCLTNPQALFFAEGSTEYAFTDDRYRVKFKDVTEEELAKAPIFQTVTIQTAEGETLNRSGQTTTLNLVAQNTSVIDKIRARTIGDEEQIQIDVISPNADDKPNVSLSRGADNGGGGSVLTVNVCHFFTAPGIEFFDPSKVEGAPYQLELSFSGDFGEDVTFIDSEVIGRSEFDSEASTQISDSPFASYAALLPASDDDEGYTLSVGVCGQEDIIRGGKVFINADGGSDLVNSSLDLQFEEKFTRFVSTAPASADDGNRSCAVEVRDNDDTLVSKNDGLYCGTTDHFRTSEANSGNRSTFKRLFRIGSVEVNK